MSTHNTIAGQISLLLRNHNYNMTHTQNSLSFEQALIDGTLCINDGCKNVLVGAADEKGNDLYNINKRLNTQNINTTCGASFFVLSNDKPDSLSINLVDIESYGLIDKRQDAIEGFLHSNDLQAADVDLVLYSNSHQKTVDELSAIFENSKLIDYQKISGTYYTNSAFAMGYGVDILLQGRYPSFDKSINRILICNNLIPENLGLILIDNNKE
ncbi:MAG: 3-oxoacyl-[acyl-carrier-protein] synthase II [Saprospiraceae bacterium]